MSTIKCAIAGVGRLGMIHAQNIVHNIPNAELKVVVTTHEESARQAAKKLGVDAWTTDYQQVVQDDAIDAIIIASPTGAHAEQIKEAIKYKKHIFVDKPITSTVEEAQSIVPLMQDYNGVLQVGFVRRFDDAYMKAAEMIRRGDIGEPIYFSSISRDPGSPPEEYIATSGGIFVDLCIHDYDISRYLMGVEVESLQSFGKALNHNFMNKYGDVDQAITKMQFSNGALGIVEGSRNSSFGYDIRAEVLGTEGMLQIGSIQRTNVLTFSNGRSTYDNILDFPSKFENAFLKEIQIFIDTVANKGESPITVMDAIKASQISEAATASFNTNKMVKVGS
ncbi:Gfo/Idh/MocA family oxidoreductase [Lysinibacillus sp. NPDC098008]|uniref:Gfo/Idh/MocA family oxidoreductase n=1 Tax=Lysinibacillus sp. NPDC098008 TaxID=3364146 RepID=UPI003805DD01